MEVTAGVAMIVDVTVAVDVLVIVAVNTAEVLVVEVFDVGGVEGCELVLTAKLKVAIIKRIATSSTSSCLPYRDLIHLIKSSLCVLRLLSY